MSIRHGLLALLSHQPMYGYQLRSTFEQTTGATWPLNIGQVYTTLSRLERDGLVEEVEEPAAEDSGQRTYALTSEGRIEVARWFTTPVKREERPRDELAIKLALALVVPGVDVHTVIGRQRTATIHTLQEYTRLKAQAGPDDLAWLLVLESLIFQAEAEVRWLDHCEARLARHRATSTTGTAATEGAGTVEEASR
jgi:DNA-binding PadR family transcriptional regulator